MLTVKQVAEMLGTSLTSMHTMHNSESERAKILQKLLPHRVESETGTSRKKLHMYPEAEVKKLIPEMNAYFNPHCRICGKNFKRKSIEVMCSKACQQKSASQITQDWKSKNRDKVRLHKRKSKKISKKPLIASQSEPVAIKGLPNYETGEQVVSTIYFCNVCGEPGNPLTKLCPKHAAVKKYKSSRFTPMKGI